MYMETETAMNRSAAKNYDVFYPIMVLSILSIAFGCTLVLPESFYGLISGVATALVIPLVAYLERVIPFRKDWDYSRTNKWVDFSRTLGLLPVIVFSIMYFYSDHLFASYKVIDLSSLHVLLQLVFVLLICEFFFYWTHRLSHELSALWKIHKFHHEVQEVHWMNSGRFSVLDILWNFLFYLMPLYLFQIDPVVVVLFSSLNVVTGTLEHANIAYEDRLSRFVFNTATLHRLHHNNDVRTSQQNYGKVLCVFDHLFNSYEYAPHKTKVDEIGAGTDMDT